MTLVTLDQLSHVTRTALMKHGAAEWVADQVARAVVEAEATGAPAYGVSRLEVVCADLDAGRINGHAEPKVTQPHGDTIVADACGGFSTPAFARGLPQAVEHARQTGAALILVRDAATATMPSFFTAQIARAGMIGLALADAGTRRLAVSLPDGAGGVARQFETDPRNLPAGNGLPEAEAKTALHRLVSPADAPELVARLLTLGADQPRQFSDPVAVPDVLWSRAEQLAR